jgi:elongation factor P
MKINGNAVKPGHVIQHEGGLWVTVRAVAVKPGKGGAFNQVELKNLISGSKQNTRFRSDEMIERVTLEQRDFQYLFDSGDALVFMDTANYEQIELQKDWVGDQAQYLKDNMIVTLELHEEKPIGISLPDYVVLTIEQTEPTIKGQTASSSYKPAICDNGMRVMVPPHIESGTRIVVATEDGSYVRRDD